MGEGEGLSGVSSRRVFAVWLKNRRVPVAAPMLRLLADGAVFAFRANVTITASASDSDGRVTKVEFFRDDGARKLGEDTTAPYSYVWLLAPSGTHYLRARATDNLGAVGTSARVTIRARGLLGWPLSGRAQLRAACRVSLLEVTGPNRSRASAGAAGGPNAPHAAQGRIAGRSGVAHRFQREPVSSPRRP